MKVTAPVWYALAAVLLLAPVGYRAATWPRHRPQLVDLTQAQAGEVLFTHAWKPNDPLSAGGDGLGPVFNANSCVACHFQGGPGGGGALTENVTTFTVLPTSPTEKMRVGLVHARATRPSFQETLTQVHLQLPQVAQPTLDQVVGTGPRRIRFPAGVSLSQRNTPALFGANLIDEIPDHEIAAQERRERLQWGLAPADGDKAPVGRALRLADGRIGRFGWKAQSTSLAGFVRAACANELGLGNPGAAQPAPLARPDYLPPDLDLTDAQCQQLTSYIASLPRPVERFPDDRTAADQAHQGKLVFHATGCADCHTPNLGSVEGLYSDLLLHPMGVDLQGGNSYYDPPPTPIVSSSSTDGPSPGEWRTPPLWGVADSAPYLHDGRAATLHDAIRLHAGQGTRSAQRYARLPPAEQAQLVAFLGTLRAP